MADLFQKISQGSILLWNVDDESHLPKRKDLIRLLDTDDFIYYKYDGHHRHYIRYLAHLKDCLYPDPNERGHPYWPRTKFSHFLFTPKEIKNQSFFLYKYHTTCRGAYFVSKNDLESLIHLLNEHEKIQRVIEEVEGWPKKIQDHQEIVRLNEFEDSVITHFDVLKLTELTQGYGEQALANALDHLKTWHETYFWKI